MKNALDTLRRVLLIESILEIECLLKIKVENNIVIFRLKSSARKICLKRGGVEMDL